MQNRILVAVLCLISLIGLILPKPSLAESIGFSLSNDPNLPPPSKSTLKVDVLDDESLLPIADPNISVSDSGNGTFMVTVKKQGYVSFSLAGVQTNHVSVYLKPAVYPPSVMASGQVQGWNMPDPDNTVYGGLVIGSLSAYDVFRFSPDLIISPLRDTIDVFGPRQIPSNVAIPNQTISVILGSFNVNKPSYRLPVTTDHPIRLAALQGEFPTDNLVSTVLSGVKIDILNQLSSTRLALTQSFKPNGDFTLNPTLSIPLVPQYQVSIHSPPFDSDVLAIAVTDMDGDRKSLIPTDVKVPLSADNPSQIQPVKLSAPASTSVLASNEELILTLAVSKSPKIVSGILTPAKSNTINVGDFLPAKSVKKTRALPGTINFRAPQTGLGALIFDDANSHPAWIVYALPAAGNVQFSTGDLAQTPVKEYINAQMDFGSSFSEVNLEGATLIQDLKRFSASLQPVQ